MRAFPRSVGLILIAFLVGCSGNPYRGGMEPWQEPIDAVDVPFTCYSCPPSTKGYCCPLPPTTTNQGEGWENWNKTRGKGSLAFVGDKQYYCDEQNNNAQCGGPCRQYHCPWIVVQGNGGALYLTYYDPDLDDVVNPICFKNAPDAWNFGIYMRQFDGIQDPKEIKPCGDDPDKYGWTIQHLDDTYPTFLDGTHHQVYDTSQGISWTIQHHLTHNAGPILRWGQFGNWMDDESSKCATPPFGSSCDDKCEPYITNAAAYAACVAKCKL